MHGIFTMKKLIVICMVLTGLVASAQQNDTLYIYDLYTDGDYTYRHTGENIGGVAIRFSFDNTAEVTINAKSSDVHFRKVIAKKAWMAGIMVVKPKYQSIKIYVKGEAKMEGSLRRDRIIPINDSLTADTIKPGFQYYLPLYKWKSPLLSGDYPESFSYVNQGTYLHECLRLGKKRGRKLIPVLQAAVLWQYNSESKRLIKVLKQNDVPSAVKGL